MRGLAMPLRVSRTVPLALLLAVHAVPAWAQDTAPATSPTHKHYEHSELADQPGPNGELAPRLQNLGTHTFPVSTTNPRAQRFIDQGDPYVDHIQATRAGILARLNLPNRELLAYQSRTGPVKWLGPGTEEAIEQLGKEGVRDLLVVPLSFVSDHIETLYEVDILFAETAREAGITGYFRPDALNTHPRFIEALAQLVLEKSGARSSVPERVPAGVA